MWLSYFTVIFFRILSPMILKNLYISDKRRLLWETFIEIVFWSYYLPVSTFSEKSELLLLSRDWPKKKWRWHTHLRDKSLNLNKCLMAHFDEKNSNFLKNLSLGGPRPGHSIMKGLPSKSIFPYFQVSEVCNWWN